MASVYSNGNQTTLPNNARALLDENFIVTVTAPNAANVVNSSGLDLVQATPYPTTDRIDFQIINNGLAAGANNKNINCWMQESADNGNWTNMAGLAVPLLVEADNNGSTVNGGNYIGKFQPGCKRYIRLQAQGEANGGAGTNGVLTLQLLF